VTATCGAANATALDALGYATAGTTGMTNASVAIPAFLMGAAAGGTYSVCFKVPVSKVNSIAAQSLTMNATVALADTTGVLSPAAKSGNLAPLAYNGTVREVYFFNPASNTNLVSLLRVTNPGLTPGKVSVTAVDDTGVAAPGGTLSFTLTNGMAVTLDSSDLEKNGTAGYTASGGAPRTATGGAASGNLGASASGTKWHLTVTGEFANMAVMSLNRGSSGVLTNTSSLVDGPTAQGAN